MSNIEKEELEHSRLLKEFLEEVKELKKNNPNNGEVIELSADNVIRGSVDIVEKMRASSTENNNKPKP